MTQIRQRFLLLSAMLGFLALLGTGAVAWASNHMNEVTAEEIVGVYRMEPASRGNATMSMSFTRFRADGKTHGEILNFTDNGERLSAEMGTAVPVFKSWHLQNGKLCIGDKGGACFDVTRDEITGDLTLDGRQQLTRLRMQTLVYE